MTIPMTVGSLARTKIISLDKGNSTKASAELLVAINLGSILV